MADPRPSVAREPSYMRKEEPPTYELSMQHQSIEHSNEALYSPPDVYRSTDFIYPPLGGPSNVSCSRTVVPPISSRDRSVTAHARARHNACVRLAMPVMHMRLAVFCLICNFVIPGLGTMIAGTSVFCCTKSNYKMREKVASCGMCIIIGVLQLILTVVFLIGWVWSILWGFAFVGTSNDEYQSQRADVDAVTEIGNDVTSGNTATQEREPPSEPTRSPPPPYAPSEEPTLNVPSGS